MWKYEWLVRVWRWVGELGVGGTGRTQSCGAWPGKAVYNLRVVCFSKQYALRVYLCVCVVRPTYVNYCGLCFCIPRARVCVHIHDHV